MHNAQKSHNTIKGEKLNIDWYVLAYMPVTLDTTHFEISPSNFDAPANAVSIIQTKICTCTRKEQNYKERQKMEKNISGCILLNERKQKKTQTDRNKMLHTACHVSDM